MKVIFLGLPMSPLSSTTVNRMVP